VGLESFGHAVVAQCQRSEGGVASRNLGCPGSGAIGIIMTFMTLPCLAEKVALGRMRREGVTDGEQHRKERIHCHVRQL
jgi:hypothetical protein